MQGKREKEGSRERWQGRKRGGSVGKGCTRKGREGRGSQERGNGGVRGGGRAARGGSRLPGNNDITGINRDINMGSV